MFRLCLADSIGARRLNRAGFPFGGFLLGLLCGFGLALDCLCVSGLFSGLAVGPFLGLGLDAKALGFRRVAGSATGPCRASSS